MGSAWSISLTLYVGEVQSGLLDAELHVEGSHLFPEDEKMLHQEELTVRCAFSLLNALLGDRERVDAGRKTILSKTLEGLNLRRGR